MSAYKNALFIEGTRADLIAEIERKTAEIERLRQVDLAARAFRAARDPFNTLNGDGYTLADALDLALDQTSRNGTTEK